MPRLKYLLILLATLALAGCDLSFYWQAMRGQMDLLQRRQPIDQLLEQPSTPEALKQQLHYVLRVRTFAKDELQLDVGENYASYADLQRPFVVWNVFATQPLSMQNERWCFPIAGCVPYRGYFAETEAEAYANDLANEGLDTYVGGVPAYSTLGWFDDAVLNTFIGRDQLSLAALIFHELAHRTFYVADDATFNESFATAVESIGLQRWIKHAELKALEPAYTAAQARQQQFLDLVLKNRSEREQLFDSDLSDSDKLSRKQALLVQLKSDYAVLKSSWGDYNGYDRWFEGPLNNAQLSTVATYHQLEPGFLALYEQSGQDLGLFIQRCRLIAKRPQPERHSFLNQLANGEIVYTGE